MRFPEITISGRPDELGFAHGTALLGQTWDWGRPLENLAVLMQLKISENHTIQMLTEPGIIGKIGLNSHGIGTCLNILWINQPLRRLLWHWIRRWWNESNLVRSIRFRIPHMATLSIWLWTSRGGIRGHDHNGFEIPETNVRRGNISHPQMEGENNAGYEIKIGVADNFLIPFQM